MPDVSLTLSSGLPLRPGRRHVRWLTRAAALASVALQVTSAAVAATPASASSAGAPPANAWPAGASSPALSALVQGWAVDGRCAVGVCVGDTAYTALQSPPTGLRAQRAARAIEWREAGSDPRAPWVVRFDLEDEDAPSPEAARIALVTLRAPGTPTGVGSLRIGDSATHLASDKAPVRGHWILSERGLRWWQADRPAGVQPAPAVPSLGVDAQQTIVQVMLNGDRLRESAHPSLAQALRVTRARLGATGAAWVPEVPADALPPGPAYAERVWLPGSVTLRFTSRPDCAAANCDMLVIERGGAPVGPSDGAPLQVGTWAARWQPTRCGGSCSPAAVAFTQGGQPVRIQYDAAFGRPGLRLSEAQEQAVLTALLRSLTPETR